MTDKLAMFIPLVKVDEQKREVWGRATQEIVDGHNEIMDYASSVPYFKKWTDTVKKRSQGKSQGNVREMHQPIAAGKLIAMQFNDSEKAIDVGAYVSDDNTWRKCLDGTLTGFSIGGDYAKRWMDMGKTRYTADPHEISMVDAPAVPTATFELIKMDGGSEMKKFAVAEPTDVQVEVHKAMLEVAPLLDDYTTPVGRQNVINNFYGEVHLGKFDNIEEQIDKLNPKLADPQVPDTFLNHEVEIEEGVTEGAKNTEDDAYQEVTSEAVIKEVNPNQPNGVVETRLQDGSTPKTTANLNIDEAAITREPIPHDEEAEEEAEHEGKDFSKALAPQLAEFQNFVKQFSASVETLARLRQEEADKLQKVDAELKLRGSRVGIARREGEPYQPFKDQPADWMQYADPANWSFAMTKALAGQHIATYNAGKGREKYAASEWMVLGRRIARMASDALGVPYKFSPADKQVERKMEKAMTGQLLNKQSDPMSLLRDVSKQLTEACDMIASDPSNAAAMLTRTLGLIDTASDVSPANPASNAKPPLEMAKADGMKCQKCGGMVKAGDKFCAACGEELQKVAKTDSPTAPTSEAAMAKEDDVNDLEKAAIEKAAVEKYIAEQEANKAAELAKAEQEKATAEALAKAQTLEEMVKQQNELLAKMQANIEAIAKGAPIPPAGDLAGIVPMAEADNPLLKALNEGNLAKAYEVVGNDNVKLYDQVNELAVRQLYNTGINVSRFGFFPAFSAEPENPAK